MYDPIRDRMVMSGGDTFEFGDPYNTWSFDLRDKDWLGVGLGYLLTGAYVFDPVGDRIVSFGGGVESFSIDRTFELELLSGTTTELFPSGYIPAKRRGSPGVYDAARHRMVLFGGLGDVIHNDAAAYDLGPGAAWDSLTTTGAPPTPRYDHALIYDASRDRLVVFGGTDDAQTFDEIWTLDFATNTWTLVGAGGPALSGAAAIYDPFGDRMVLIGGETGSGPSFDAWALSLSDWSWTSLPSPGPTFDSFHESIAVYDPIERRLIACGWDHGNDVLALSLTGTPEWTQLHAGSPVARWSHSAIHDSGNRRMVIFGGATGTGTSVQLGDTWAYDYDRHSWTGITPAGTPPAPRSGHSAIYDAANERMIVFGGGFADLWELSFSGTPTWTALPQTGDLPSARSHHTAIYDPIRQRMIMYGPSLNLNVYVLDLGGPPVWTRFTPAGGPTFPAGSIYDPVRDRMVVLTAAGVWELSLAGPLAWTQIATAGAMPPSAAFTFMCPVYDSVHDRIVMFSGGEVHAFLDQTYALSLSGIPTWSQLLPAGSVPPGLAASVSTYDPVHDRMILHGGVHSTGTGFVTQFNHVYHLTFGDVVSTPQRVAADGAHRIVAVRPNPGSSTHAFTLELTTPNAQGQIEVFAVTGQRVWARPLGRLGNGRHSIEWDGRQEDGTPSAPGVYLVRLIGGGASSTSRFVRVR